MKRIALFLCFSIALISCEYFEKKKVYTEDIVNEELETINWKDVDQYPAFTECEPLDSKEERKRCFEHTLTNHVSNYFSSLNLIVSEDINDTLYIKLEIDKTGTIDVYSIKADNLTRAQIPKLDSLLERNIASLPKIYPAIKRGQQVHTEFTLPIIIKIE